MRRAFALSVAGHLLAGATLVLWQLRPGGAPPRQVTAEMVFVDPGGSPAGAQPQQQQPPPSPPPAPQPKPAQRVEQPPAPPVPTPPVDEAKAEPAPTKPAPPAATAAPAAQPAPPREGAPTPPPAVRLGDDEGAGSTDDVTGENTAVGPDPSAPNIPPRYPPDSARRGEQGTVLLAVTVAPEGEATVVTVFRSSGYPMLDRAAQSAVARWRFTPKHDGGEAVEAHTLVRVSFKLE